MLDGVQSAEKLYQKLQDVGGSAWKGLEGEVFRQDVSAFGMFLLGILTSLAPCSIALMIAVFSYVMTIRKKDEYLRKSVSTSREGFMIGIAFTLGMAAVFFVLGLFISQVGLFIRDSRIFDLMAGLIMILLGISNIKPLDEILEPVTSRIRPNRGEESTVRQRRACCKGRLRPPLLYSSTPPSLAPSRWASSLPWAGHPVPSPWFCRY